MAEPSKVPASNSPTEVSGYWAQWAETRIRNLEAELAEARHVITEYRREEDKYDAAQARILDLESELRLASAARDYANDMLDKERGRIRELEAALRKREDTLVTMREEYLHIARVLRSARDLLQGEFYAEALGELDDACSQSDRDDKHTTKGNP